jgi:hypothetical protein
MDDVFYLMLFMWTCLYYVNFMTTSRKWSYVISLFHSLIVSVKSLHYITCPDPNMLYYMMHFTLAYLTVSVVYIIQHQSEGLSVLIHHTASITLLYYGISADVKYYPFINRLFLFEIPIVFLNIQLLYNGRHIRTLNGLITLVLYFIFRFCNSWKILLLFTDLTIHEEAPMSVHAGLYTIFFVQSYWMYKIVLFLFFDDVI